MRFFIFVLLLFLMNSCNLENGVQKNYIISQMKDSKDNNADTKDSE